MVVAIRAQVTILALVLMISVNVAVDGSCLWQPHPHPVLSPIFYLGPEAYYLKRRLETGTRQEGSLYGVRAIFERILPMSFYYAFDGYWAKGHLTGHSSRRFPIHSDMTDRDIEARLGYTLWLRCIPRFYLTPLIGFGYFSETNDFEPPTTFIVLFRTHFAYVPIGFLTRFYLTSQLSVGVDYKVKITMDGRTEICDPNRGDGHLNFSFRRHRQLDIPIRYRFCGRARNLEVQLALFWRERRYGRRPGEQDFFETRITISGARIMLGYDF
jgi:hypothetical protein